MVQRNTHEKRGTLYLSKPSFQLCPLFHICVCSMIPRSSQCVKLQQIGSSFAELPAFPAQVFFEASVIRFPFAFLRFLCPRSYSHAHVAWYEPTQKQSPRKPFEHSKESSHLKFIYIWRRTMLGNLPVKQPAQLNSLQSRRSGKKKQQRNVQTLSGTFMALFKFGRLSYSCHLRATITFIAYSRHLRVTFTSAPNMVPQRVS